MFREHHELQQAMAFQLSMLLLLHLVEVVCQLLLLGGLLGCMEKLGVRLLSLVLGLVRGLVRPVRLLRLARLGGRRALTLGLARL